MHTAWCLRTCENCDRNKCMHFLKDAIDFLRHNMKEIVPSMDSNLTFSLLKMLNCFFRPYFPKEVSFARTKLYIL